MLLVIPYIHLRAKLRSSHPYKEELILAIMKLSNAEDSHSSTSAESTECVNAVDRGGLCHVSDNTFLFFCSIEEALRAFLTVLKVKELSHGMKSTIVKSVIENENVEEPTGLSARTFSRFHWSIVWQLRLTRRKRKFFWRK